MQGNIAAVAVVELTLKELILIEIPAAVVDVVGVVGVVVVGDFVVGSC